MENQQPEALVLASLFERCVIAFGETETSSRAIAAKELRRLHARVQELEAMLDAVGAGGVSAQRVTQGKDHIEQPIEMVSPPVVLPEPDEYQYRMKGNWDAKLPWTPWEACSKESAAIFRKLKEVQNWIYEVRERYTEQQVRELLATGGQWQKVITWHRGAGLMWDVHASGKWLLRVVSPLNWDAHSVHQELVHAGYAEHIDVRQVHAEQGAAPTAKEEK